MRLESTAATYTWRLSTKLHSRGWRWLAKAIKTANFFAFRALLPPECIVGVNLQMKHYALVVVVHPNTVIRDNVTIHHSVTIAGESWIGSPHKVVIEDNAVIGVGATIIPRPDRGLRIGARSIVGAGAVVTKDVPDDHVATGVPAKCRPLRGSTK